MEMESLAHRNRLSRRKMRHNRLLKFAENSDTVNVARLLNHSVLNVKFGRPYHKTILPIVRFNLLQKSHWRTVDAIIEGGCEIFDKNNNKEELLFFAAAGGRFEKLSEVVRYFKQTDPGFLKNTREGDTPLMFLVKYGNASRENFIKCASILIQEAGVDLNIPDYYKCTVILRLVYLYGQNFDNAAILRNVKEVIKIILGGQAVDVDSHRWHGKTARQYITLYKIFDASKLQRFSYDSLNTKTNLFATIIDRDEKRFKSIRNVDSYDLDNGQDTLLQMACKFNLSKTVKFLLKRGADPNLTSGRNHESPLEISAKMNNSSIFNVLLNHEKTTISKSIYFFFVLYKGNKIKYKYFLGLLKSDKLDVSYVCGRGNSPLHYAILLSQKDATMRLLERGASLCFRNKYGRSPLDYVDLKLLSSCFDNFVRGKKEQNVFHENHTIVYDYRIFLNDTKDSNCNIHCRHISKIVLEISRNSRLGELLMHPLLTSYVQIRRKQNKNVYNGILAFQYFFWAWFVLTTMVTFNFQDVHGVVFWPFFILYLCKLIMTVVQTLINISDWNMVEHNLVDYILLSLTAFLLISKTVSFNKNVCSIIALLLSTYSMLSWAEYQDHFSVYLITLRRVSVKFLSVLILFSSVIFTFGLCFYQLFNIHWTLEREFKDTEENVFFGNLYLTIFKTFVMMTGEYDTGSIPFERSGIFGHFVFLLFVTVISLLFINILIGYTVGDVMELKSACELQKRRYVIDLILFINRLQLFFKKQHVKGDLHQGILCENPTRSKDVDKNDYTAKFYPNRKTLIKNHKICPIGEVKLDLRSTEDARNILLRKRELAS